MKKKYITPACTAISVRTTHLFAVSQNEYSNNQGRIHFSSTVVAAEDAD